MSMLEGYWDIEGIRQVEDEEFINESAAKIAADVIAHFEPRIDELVATLVHEQVEKMSENLEKLAGQEEAKYVLQLHSKGKDAIEISYLLDIPLEKVDGILKENNTK